MFHKIWVYAQLSQGKKPGNQQLCRAVQFSQASQG